MRPSLIYLPEARGGFLINILAKQNLLNLNIISCFVCLLVFLGFVSLCVRACVYIHIFIHSFFYFYLCIYYLLAYLVAGVGFVYFLVCFLISCQIIILNLSKLTFHHLALNCMMSYIRTYTCQLLCACS